MSKSTEALLYVKKAEKCLKTSLLKWSIDRDGAITNYNKAAECYRDANELTEAIDIYKKISDMYLESDSLFYAAKALEDAANLYKALKDYPKMVELILTAGEKLRINGNSDSACQLMKRTAKSVEDEYPQSAAKLYMFASDAAQDKDGLRDAGDYAGQAARLFVRVGDIDNCLTALQAKTELFSRAGVPHEAGKAVVCRVLVHLHRKDPISAHKTYMSCIEMNSFGSTEDSSPVSLLLNAIDNENYDEVRRLLKSPTFIYLENDFVKLARDLKFPEMVHKTIDNSQSGDHEVAEDDDIN